MSSAESDEAAVNVEASDGSPSHDAASSTPASAEPAVNARSAGRGGLAITFSKIYFLIFGFFQQAALVWVLGVGMYGALRTTQSPASITYNPLITTGIQGVSRAVVNATDAAREATIRQVLVIHSAMGLVIALGFFFVAPPVITFLGAPHVAGAVRIMSLVVFLYGVYTPLIGVLNGRRRFLSQAGFDMLATTLRTVGLIAGAWVMKGGERAVAAVEGSVTGFVISSSIMVILAGFAVGIGKKGAGAPSLGEHLRFVMPLMLAQVVLNLLLQADTNTLRYFASRAAVAAGQHLEAADPLVGAYNATQLFGFLPYQLLMGITFVLFPLLARAYQERDQKSVAQFVETGMRLALIIVGVVVSVSSGLSEQLLLLIYPRQAAELGADAMHVLTLGLGCFAIFGILLTILTSIKREVVGLWITAGGFLIVLAMNYLFVKGEEFGPDLLWWTAVSTSVGVAATTAAAAVSVYRTTGALVPLATSVRVLGALAITIAVARLLPSAGRIVTVAESGVVAVLFVFLLALSRELTPADFAMVRRVVSRGKPRA